VLSVMRWRAAALALSLLGSLAAQSPEQAAYKISVNVDMVLLDATVRDRKGTPVTNLREENFNVYEDGVRQSIRLFRHEDVPVAVGIVVDHSGSMRSKLPHVIAAAKTFVQVSNPEDRMFVVNFNEKVTLGLPDGVSFTNRSDLLENAISQAPTTGMTALYDATILAVERLQAGVRVKKVLLLISDGGDNASRRTLAELTQLAARSSVVIYAIGIFDPDDPDRNPDVLRRLAVASGGEAFFPGEYADVVAICGRIARDIRSQYTIGYVSSSTARPGAWRSIQVVAGATPKDKLSVRTRTGYIAADESRPAKEADKW
jgi:Ca-activated chloride channel family protein